MSRRRVRWRGLRERRAAWTQKLYHATGADYTTITQARRAWRELSHAKRAKRTVAA